MARLMKQDKTISVGEQNRGEQAILLIRSFNGENIMQELQMIEVLKNIHLNKLLKTQEFLRRVWMTISFKFGLATSMGSILMNIIMTKSES